MKTVLWKQHSSKILPEIYYTGKQFVWLVGYIIFVAILWLANYEKNFVKYILIFCAILFPLTANNETL